VSWFSWLTGNAIDPYVREFKLQMEEEGARVRIGEVRRSVERQRQLYAQGRTTPGPVVTWTLHSKHIRGRAFDFDFVSALDQTDDDAWELAAQVGEGLGLRSGRRWDVQDDRHLELPG
jgi:peptidoglycan L-alanyl-D-glutamate endopeptidase CwlK